MIKSSIFIFLCAVTNLISSPASVVVIGGGPSGLGAAIEAKKSGADVVLIEKRNAYTRQNALFLYTVTLELLDRWGGQIPLMEELEFKGERRGFVLIKDLEESLSSLVDALGVRRIQGEFIGFSQNPFEAIIKTNEGTEFLSYDVLVGADGMHSKTREALAINTYSFGQAIGGVSMIKATNPEKLITAEIKSHPEAFVKKVCVPSATIIFIQNHPSMPLKELNSSEMVRLTSEIGWNEEAIKMERESLVHLENILISLQRATHFSDHKRSVILLGDAAATASFYHGTGVNFSFKTTQAARDFFENWPQDRAFEQFNQAMEVEVDKLLETSLPLF